LVRELIATRGRRCEDPQCTTPDHVVELKNGGAALDADPHHGRLDAGNVDAAVCAVHADGARKKMARRW
jgi:hypothetical protein